MLELAVPPPAASSGALSARAAPHFTARFDPVCAPGAAHDAALGRPPHGAHSTVQAEAGARVYTTYSATTCAQPRLLVTYSCEM